MLSKKFKLFLFLVFGGFCVLALAQQNARVKSNVSAIATTVKAQPQFYCPTVSELKSHAMIWYAGKQWRSYSPSFVKKIATFVGAQWIGINVGKIICLYRGAEKITFPVALEPVHPVLVPTPDGDNWAPIPHRTGYKQCFGDTVKACPFAEQVNQDSGDIFQQIKYQGATS